MKIKIIADNPEDGQSSIQSLIGCEFEAKIIHGRMTIEAGNFPGKVVSWTDKVVLNSDEYEIVKD